MPIGKIIEGTTVHSPYALVRGEHGTTYTVHESELDEGSKEGDEMAYRVDTWQHRSHRSSTTLRKE